MPAVAAWARGANEAKVVAATTSAAAAAVVAVVRFVRGWAWAVMMGGVILCWKSRREGWTEINGKGTMTGVPRLMGLDRKPGKKREGMQGEGVKRMAALQEYTRSMRWVPSGWICEVAFADRK